MSIIGIDHPNVPGLLRAASGERADRLLRSWSDLRVAFDRSGAGTSPDLLYARVVFWLDLGDRDRAARDLAEAARLRPADPTPPAADRARSAVAIRDRLTLVLAAAAAREYAAEAESSFNYGVTALQYHRPATALLWFEDAVQLQPDKPLNWYYRATTRRALGDADGSARDARVGAYLESRAAADSPAVRRFIGEGLSGIQGRERYWLDQFRNADPTAQLAGVETELQRSQRYHLLDADGVARATGRGGAPPDDPTIPPEIRLLPSQQRQDWKRVTAAIEKNPDVPELYAARAALWRAAHSYDQALRDLLKVADLLKGKKSPPGQGDAAAARVLRESLELFDRMPVPPHREPPVNYYAAGLTAFDANEFSRARASFSDAIHHDPFEPVFWYYRAVAHAYLNDPVRAQEDARVGAALERRRAGEVRYEPARHLGRVQGAMRAWLDSVRTGAR